MNKLEQLIKIYCPNGPDCIKIGDVVNYEQPSKYIVKSTDYKDEFDTPVLTAGQTFILGYTNETNGIYKASKENPVIIFDDFTGAFKWVDFPFKVKSSAIKMLTSKNNSVVLRYIYHVMGNLNFTSDEHKRLWISVYSEFLIPVPPLPVQEEIVRILDKFTKLKAELNAELNARKLQYIHFRDQLLTFENSVPLVKIGDFCDLLTGYPFDSSQFTTKGIRLMRGMNIKRGTLDFDETLNRYWSSADRLEKFLLNNNDIVIAMDGSLVGKSYGFVRKEDLPLLLVQRVTRIRTDKANIKYVYHYIASGAFTNYVEKRKTKGAIPHISLNDIANFKIPLPSLDVQQRIVNVLDNFDSICSDLSIGLPAEISARSQQYNYYRDLLFEYAANGLNFSRAQQS